MDIKTLLGKKIREYRIRKNLTQFQLAELIEIDNKHLSSIELGKNMPNPQTLVKLTQVFEIEPKDLFEFYHLQKPADLKKYVIDLVEEMDETQLESVCKYIRSFVL